MSKLRKRSFRDGPDSTTEDVLAQEGGKAMEDWGQV